MKLNITSLVKKLIHFTYSLSPYFWLDRYYKKQESPIETGSEAWQAIRNKRLFLSEFYIVFWLAASFSLMVLSAFFNLPSWLVPLLLLRIFGLLNKELGVILFGTCKITEGRMVAATGRVIVLAMANFLTAMFLFSAVYQISGKFLNVPDMFQTNLPIAGIVQGINGQFTLSRAFEPADVFTWVINLGQSGFMFVFGTIILSMFVALLNIKPLKG